MRILLTAFNAFGGEKINPTEILLNRLDEVRRKANLPESVKIDRLFLPTEFLRASELLKQKLLAPEVPSEVDGKVGVVNAESIQAGVGSGGGRCEARPRTYDAVLALGQAGGRCKLSLERIAINIADSAVADNCGMTLQEAKIQCDGAAAYFATLPIRSILNAGLAAGVPFEISNSAGTYVCNYIMYNILYWAEQNSLGGKAAWRGGFLHVPFLPEQTLAVKAPCMSLAMMEDGLAVCLQKIVAEGDNDERK